MKILLLFSTVFLAFLRNAGAEPISPELFKTIFEGYNKDLFPILQNENSSDDTLSMKFGIALINIEFDEEKSTLIAHIWNRMVWNDTRLAYNAKRYGKTVLRIPSTLVWTPDITLYNSMDFVTPPIASHYQVLVYPEGKVLWVPPAIYKVHCEEDLTDWPWDTQNCRLKFGSWVHSDFSMNVTFYNDKEEVDLADYQGSKRWLVKEEKAVRETKMYPPSTQPYSSLIFNIVFQRQASSKAYILLVPIVVVCLLTLATFCLPPLATERLNLAFVNVIVIVLHLLYFVMCLPLRNNHPKIACLLVSCLIIETISIFVFIATSCCLHRQTQRKPPKFLTNLASGICGTFLCVSTVKRKGANNMQMEGEQGSMVSTQSGNTDSTSYHQCYQVMSLLDRVLFVIFFFVFIGLFASLS